MLPKKCCSLKTILAQLNSQISLCLLSLSEIPYLSSFPCPPPFFDFSLSLLDLCLMSYINTIPMEKVRHGTDMVQTSVFEGMCACIHTHTRTHTKSEKPVTLPCLGVKCRERHSNGRRRKDQIRDGDVKKRLELNRKVQKVI